MRVAHRGIPQLTAAGTMSQAHADELFSLFGYDPAHWRSLRRRGLFDCHSGVRLIQAAGYTPGSRCSHQFAAPRCAGQFPVELPQPCSDGILWCIVGTPFRSRMNLVPSRNPSGSRDARAASPVVVSPLVHTPSRRGNEDGKGPRTRAGLDGPAGGGRRGAAAVPYRTHPRPAPGH